MKPHFSEADLLETYYARPGESMPVMMHLADCSECAARYERLEARMRSLRSCPHDEKPDTFWVRQRLSIMRRIQARRSTARVPRMAAAAMLVLALGGLVTWSRIDDHKTLPAAVPVQTATLDDAATLEKAVPADPWKSDQLDEYSSMVAWETWEEPKGDHSS